MSTLDDVKSLVEQGTIQLVSQKDYSSATEYAYSVLKDYILGMFLPPGTQLTEKSVSELLKISPTPVREAFARLKRDELLVVFPQRGTQVSRIGMKRTLDARLVRKTLERDLMTRLRAPLPPSLVMEMRQNLEKQEFCIQSTDFPGSPMEFVKLDNAFHRALFAGAELESVWEMINQFSLQGDRLRVLYFRTRKDWNILLKQHRNILDAASGKGGMLLEAWEAHFKSIEVNYEMVQKELPDYFE